jgi:hypothetical protein
MAVTPDMAVTRPRRPPITNGAPDADAARGPDGTGKEERRCVSL